MSWQFSIIRPACSMSEAVVYLPPTSVKEVHEMWRKSEGGTVPAFAANSRSDRNQEPCKHHAGMHHLGNQVHMWITHAGG